MAEGKSNESTGIILGIGSRTAEKHVENILAKLGVENRVEAAMRAREQRAQPACVSRRRRYRMAP